jgi:hypothetical protein
LKKSLKNKIQKIEDLLNSMRGEEIRFIFSYIVIGKTLNELRSDVITNVSDDIASKTLGVVTDNHLYPEEKLPFQTEEEELDDKLRLFNAFNIENKKPEA